MAGSELTKPIQILLVEDNPGDARLCQEAVKECKDCKLLHVAVDGEDALEFLKKRGKYADAEVPDLILLDLNLPKKNGREVLTEIKADEKLQGIPVVILTVSSSEEDISSTCDLQADCFITKPVDYERLTLTMQAIRNLGSASSSFLLMERCVHGASHLRKLKGES